MMASTIDETLTPILKRNYTADSKLTDLLRVAIQQAADLFSSRFYESQSKRLAQRVVTRAESESSQAFVEQINRSMGIDISALITRESLGDYFDASVEANVALISSLSSGYFDDIQREVMDSIMRGDSITAITRNLQSVTGATYNRAYLISRDQVSKIQGDVNRVRQQNSGITRFKWSTSEDRRVSGNPAGKYPNAKIKCFMLARADVGYGKGVYLWSRGASYGGETGLFPGRAHIQCRCTATPQVQGLDF